MSIFEQSVLDEFDIQPCPDDIGEWLNSIPRGRVYEQALGIPYSCRDAHGRFRPCRVPLHD